MTSALYTPVTLGSMNLANRLVMAPLTRIRSDEDGTPTMRWWSTTGSGPAWG